MTRDLVVAEDLPLSQFGFQHNQYKQFSESRAVSVALTFKASATNLQLSQSNPVLYKCNLGGTQRGGNFFVLSCSPGAPPSVPPTLDLVVHILPIFQISHGPYGPYVLPILVVSQTLYGPCGPYILLGSLRLEIYKFT